MRSVVLLASAIIFAGLAAVAVVAVERGSGPAETDSSFSEAQVLVGGSLVGVGLVLMALAAVRVRRQRLVALLVLGALGVVICLGLRWLHLLLFGIDPGFRMDIFDGFDWSVMTRVVLFPAVGQMGVVLVWFAPAAAIVIAAQAIQAHRALRKV